MIRLVFALVAAVTMVQISAQEPTYGHLSERGRELFDGSAADYDALPETKRTTFHAIVHALEAVGVDHLVVSVDQIWGEDNRSREGRDQYRLSVTLAQGAVDYLVGRDDFNEDRLGHVKLRNGDLIGGLGVLGLGIFSALRETQSVRQVQTDLSPASIQISWRTNDPTVGDIDIDYIRKRNIFAHNSPRNSDVTFGTHYVRHLRSFGGLPEWWQR